MDSAYIGIVGTVVGASLTAIFSLVRELLARKKKGAYLAIRISCILDKYVDECVAVVGDDGSSYGGPSGADGKYYATVRTPKLDFQSLDVDWHSLSPELMYEILSFPSKAEEADRRIDSTSTDDDPPYYSNTYEERQFQYAILGISAGHLSSKLMSKYNLPERKYDVWNPIEYMEEKRKKIFDIKTQRELHHVTP